MHWEDEAIVVSVRKHGETSAVIGLFTAEHGRVHGHCKGALGKQQRGVFVPGNRVKARWSARLEEHLGTLVCEAGPPFGALALGDGAKASVLQVVCGLVEEAFAEREPHPAAYARLEDFLQHLSEPDWLSRWALLELAWVAELGFGLELGPCAICGREEALAYVSPKTGRGVSAACAGDYAPRLLPLPRFIQQETPGETGKAELAAAFRLTGYFLEHLAMEHARPHVLELRRMTLNRLLA